MFITTFIQRSHCRRVKEGWKNTILDGLMLRHICAPNDDLFLLSVSTGVKKKFFRTQLQYRDMKVIHGEELWYSLSFMRKLQSGDLDHMMTLHSL